MVINIKIIYIYIYMSAIDNIIKKQDDGSNSHNFNKCIKLLQEQKKGHWIWWIFPNTVFSAQNDNEYSLTNDDLYDLAKLDKSNALELFKRLIIISSVVLENYITNNKKINDIMNTETDTYKFLNSIFLFYLLYKHTNNKIYLLYKYIFELIYPTAILDSTFDERMFSLIRESDTYEVYEQNINENKRAPSYGKRSSDFTNVKNHNSTLLRLENFCKAKTEYKINKYYEYAKELFLDNSSPKNNEFIKLNNSDERIQYLNCMVYNNQLLLYYNYYNDNNIIYNCIKNDNSECLKKKKKKFISKKIQINLILLLKLN